MITKDFILSKLPPYTGSKKVLIDEQDTQDIIKGILDNHELYKSDYDKISEYFVGSNDINTAKNVYFFLKKYVPYYIEPTKLQTLRSPSAILSFKADCKAYANFVNGIFDSLNRKGIFKIPLAYRFASYKVNSNNPGHVFAVLYPGSNNEIWVDNVLDNFNEKKQPTYVKDKKIKMALVSMSGLDNKQPTLDELKNYRDKLVSIQAKLVNNGQIVPGNQNDLQMKVAINRVTKGIQRMQTMAGFFDNIFGGDKDDDEKKSQQNSLQTSYLVEGGKQVLNALLTKEGVSADFFSQFGFLSAFDNSTYRWKSRLPILAKLSANQRVAYYIDKMKKGDKFEDAAKQYFELFGRSTGTKSGFSDVGQVSKDVAQLFNDLVNEKYYKGASTYNAGGISHNINEYTINTNNTKPSLVDNFNNDGTKKAGISPILLIALAGAGIYFFTRKKSA